MPARNQKEAAVQRSVLIRAAVEHVYAAFGEEDRVRTWYYDDAEVDLRGGGSIVFEGPEGDIRANVLEAREPNRVVMEYDPPWWGTVTIELKPTRTGTRLTLQHQGFEGREEWVERFSWGWQDTLRRLKAECEGRPVK